MANDLPANRRHLVEVALAAVDRGDRGSAMRALRDARREDLRRVVLIAATMEDARAKIEAAYPIDEED